MIPTGTVTFLFTDIEGSTKLWEEHPDAMKAALAKHDSLLKEAIASNRGYLVKTTGDGVHAVFTTALEGINAAMAAQRGLQRPSDVAPPVGALEVLQLCVRMGLHTGEAELRDGDYYGPSLNRAARIMSIGHGGQVLLSETTAQVVREQLPKDIYLLELGEHYLKGLARPEHISQLVIPDLRRDFPPLNSISIATNNLPAQLTSFIGREKEIAEIKAMLAAATPCDSHRSGWHGQDPSFDRSRLTGTRTLYQRRLDDRACSLCQIRRRSSPRWQRRLVCKNRPSARWHRSSPIICATSSSCSFSITANISSPPARLANELLHQCQTNHPKTKNQNQTHPISSEAIRKVFIPIGNDIANLPSRLFWPHTEIDHVINNRLT